MKYVKNFLFLATTFFSKTQYIPFKKNMARAASYLPPTTFTTTTKKDDPDLWQQWHIENAGIHTGTTKGIDLNIKPVWQDYTGRGIKIAVIDNGFDYTHPDLAASYQTEHDYDAVENDFDAKPHFASDNHGTSVMSVITAAKDNGLYGAGVAPEALAYGYRMGFGRNGSITQEIKLLEKLPDMDVANMSWGYSGPFTDNFFSPLFSNHYTTLKNVVETGRNGKGTILVFAGGNEREEGDSSNYHNLQNSRFTIAVGAHDGSGNFASFSSPGANLLVSAPGVNIYTGDRMGTAGYTNQDMTYINGTSFAAPMVAGITALMLEANPNLGYRDVQDILVYAAKSPPQQAISATTEWRYNQAKNWNGGGLHYGSDYGFGLIDARNAVRLAEVWQEQKTFANEITLTKSKTYQAPKSFGFQNNVFELVKLNEDVRVEHVELTLDINHSWWGDLKLILTSPQGTRSVLMDSPGKSTVDPLGIKGSGNLQFTFASTQFWGETSKGHWALSLEDNEQRDHGLIYKWDLKVYGSTPNEDTNYIFTDEYAAQVAKNAGRSLISDHLGKNTLNAATLTQTIDVDLLKPLQRLGSTPLITDSKTKFTHVYGGDNHDHICGSNENNHIFGGRGDDMINGRGGNDTLWGGKGFDMLIGGGGADLFQFRSFDEDYDTIQDFEIIHDKIDLSYFKFSTQGATDNVTLKNTYVKLEQNGSDTMLYCLSGKTQFTHLAILKNVKANLMSDAHFKFA